MPQSKIIHPAIFRAKWQKLTSLVRRVDLPVVDAAIAEIERLRNITNLDDMEFCDAILEERQRLNMTQVQAAAFLEVSPRTYWLWESGGNVLPVTQDGALARLRNIETP